MDQDNVLDNFNFQGKSFEEMLKDQEFVAELRKSEMDVIPMPGAQIGKLVDELERLPPATIERVRQAYNSGR